MLRQAQVARLASHVLPQYGTVPAFEFTDQNGQPFGSPQLVGKIWIADFVYSTCPGPCPMISSRMGELQKPLRDTDVKLVSFSVDPQHDTPAVLREYAAQAQRAAWALALSDWRQGHDLPFVTRWIQARVPEVARRARSIAPAWSWSIAAAPFAATMTRPMPTRSLVCSQMWPTCDANNPDSLA